jgi:hypothetical protein
MLLGDFIGEAVAEIQPFRMRISSPARIGCGDPACRGGGYRQYLKAEPTDHMGHFFADVAPSRDDQGFCHGSGGIMTSVSVSKSLMQASASASPSAIAIRAEVSTAIIEANRLVHRGSLGFLRRILRRLP